jgi:hypothetical protein
MMKRTFEENIALVCNDVKKNMNLDVLEAIGITKQCTFCIMGQQVQHISKLNALAGGVVKTI